ncbi:DoxX family protein [Mucilaginibacter celer]|uniref:DoxX family protein n=1 Tax=Mucilaginibacter celer TaxID=2305508 RepID=A0A494VI36_9SPHI|nr:DoxX family protein [Mucilaginibacter celer]AYL94497.1 DoxX family protein [Mucilaginibacter celer]
MKNTYHIAQLYLRLALAIGFLLPVADRLGLFGPAGQNGVSWGSWDNFVVYTNTLIPFVNHWVAGVMGFLATVAEASIAVMFIVGFKIRVAALTSFGLTLIFALCMAIFLGFKAPFTYSVWADSAGSLLLASIPVYRWSIDNKYDETDN